LNSQLYAGNTPELFWRLLLEPKPTPDQWAEAIRRAAAVLPPAVRAQGDAIEALLTRTLGEGQFGSSHWQLSYPKRVYYALKPVVPRAFTHRIRRMYGNHRARVLQMGWPIENRYVLFQLDLVAHLLEITGRRSAPFINFWPQGNQFAFVLTHDIETADGQRHVEAVADLEEALGFRSSFYFVPERYPLDLGLMGELRSRGFEVGVHGLNHVDGLFAGCDEFKRQVQRINRYLSQFDAAGFRAPLTQRQPEWMQDLEIEYDTTFFDTDPYEPIAGGTMSIWPFQLGHFVELPYTLVQDHTLAVILGESTPRLWLEKVDFIQASHGMALSLTHPDYLRSPRTWRLYADFLRTMRERADYYHALPKEVARWWRARTTAATVEELPAAAVAWVQASPEGMRATIITRGAEVPQNRQDASASR
jgi:peptidoglycan/xylan/chitin deacetylase (PgdA/CDA1 family)